MTSVSVEAEDHFAVIPEWVLYADVSAQAVRLYAVLRRKADNDTGSSFYSRRVLANLLQVKDPKVVDRTVAELERIGAVVVTRGRTSEYGDPLTNLYTVKTRPYRPEGVVVEKPLPSDSKATRGSGKKATRVVVEKGDELKAIDLRASTNSLSTEQTAAHAAADAWWRRQEPRPIGKNAWHSLLRVCQAAEDRGYSRTQIEAALNTIGVVPSVQQMDRILRNVNPRGPSATRMYLDAAHDLSQAQQATQALKEMTA